MKKFTAFILSTLMLISLSACGSNTTGGNGGTNDTNGSGLAKAEDVAGSNIKVSIFAQEHEQVMYRTIFDRIEEEYGVSVALEVGGDQYWPELEAAITAGTEPDVFYLDIPSIKKRVWAGKVLPLDSYINVDELDNIWPEALNLFRYDETADTLGSGSIYGLPKDFSAYAMGANVAIIEKRRNEVQALVDDGTLPFFPERDENGNLPVYTFSEFAALCAALTFEDDTLPATAGSTSVYGTHLWEEMCIQSFVWGAGGELLDESSTKVQYTSDEFLEGYGGFMKIVEEGGSGLSTDETTGYLKFLAGRVCFFPTGTWDVGAFQEIERDETVNPGKEWFEFDLFAWPVSDAYADLSIEDRQDKWFGRIDSVGYAVSANTKNPAAAAYIAYLLSADEEVQREMAKAGGQLPNIQAMAEGEYLTDDIYYPPSRDVFVSMLQGVNGKRVPTTLTFNDTWFSEGFLSGVDSVWSYYEGTEKGVTPMSVPDYLAAVEENCQRLLNEAIEDEKMLNPNG